MKLNPVNEVLIDRNIPQYRLAAELGVSTTHLNRVIHGKSRSTRLRYKIAKKLRRSISDLWPDSG